MCILYFFFFGEKLKIMKLNCVMVSNNFLLFFYFLTPLLCRWMKDESSEIFQYPVSISFPKLINRIAILLFFFVPFFSVIYFTPFRWFIWWVIRLNNLLHMRDNIRLWAHTKKHFFSAVLSVSNLLYLILNQRIFILMFKQTGENKSSTKCICVCDTLLYRAYFANMCSKYSVGMETTLMLRVPLMMKEMRENRFKKWTLSTSTVWT